MNLSAVGANDDARKRAVGEAIRRARESRRFSGADLAKRAGIRPGTLSDVENGKSFPDLSTLLAISDALEMSLDQVVGRAPHIIAAGVSPMPAVDFINRLDAIEQRQATGFAAAQQGFVGVERTVEHLAQLLVARNLLSESDRVRLLHLLGGGQ